MKTILDEISGSHSRVAEIKSYDIVASTKETTLIGRISDVRPEHGTDFVT